MLQIPHYPAEGLDVYEEQNGSSKYLFIDYLDVRVKVPIFSSFKPYAQNFNKIIDNANVELIELLTDSQTVHNMNLDIEISCEPSFRVSSSSVIFTSKTEPAKFKLMLTKRNLIWSSQTELTVYCDVIARLDGFHAKLVEFEAKPLSVEKCYELITQTANSLLETNGAYRANL